jgi:L-seryl-tRNA(Ser) seleniumtransferase/D-glucosaminate-6-phosphate ammonia-lyase
MGSIFEEMGLPKVINARGHVTHLGSAILPDEVGKAMVEASKYWVEMSKLKDKAGEIIAELTGAEAACVTAGASAGMVQAAIACMAGSDLAKIRQLPDTTGMKSEVLVQLGHYVSYMDQVAAAGAKVKVTGWIWPVLRVQLEAAINEATACVFQVISGHCQQSGTLGTEEVIDVCRKRGVPAIVDAAAEFDHKRFIAMGADLVIYSGGKAFRGPGSTGFVCGRKDLIDAMRMQYSIGIARGMKVDKEGIVGLLTALKMYDTRDHQAEYQVLMKRAQFVCEQLQGIPHVDVFVAFGGAESGLKTMMTPIGKPVPAVRLVLDEEALGVTARNVFQTLALGNPSIHVGDHAANVGILAIGVDCLADGDENSVCKAVKNVLLKKTPIKETSGIYSGFLRA